MANKKALKISEGTEKVTLFRIQLKKRLRKVIFLNRFFIFGFQF